MDQRRTRRAITGAVATLALAAGVPSAQAIHFYRGTGSGCSAADGPTTDDPEGTTQNVTATVVVGHNTFSEGVSGLAAPTGVETRIKAGDSITWTWNSSHCHSVTGQGWDSGFHYPTEAPESQQVAPGAFDYPLLDETPTLSYTRTFTTPGTFAYSCVHHASIGMTGVVIVDAA